jgi:hypothetical protein
MKYLLMLWYLPQFIIDMVRTRRFLKNKILVRINGVDVLMEISHYEENAVK